MPLSIRFCLILVLAYAGCGWLLLVIPAHAQSAISEVTIGVSGEGRAITALRVGTGPRKLALIGDTHGGPEANTYQLMLMLADYFRANPGAVPASISLYIVPTINPDGLALGTRFNARGVDLNRNLNTDLDSCPENDWSVHVQGAYGVESDTGGPYADSEVESRVMRSFVLDASAVIYYHSNAGNVFPAYCEHAPSIALAQHYAAAAGYEYARYWQKYTISGGMHDWAASLGIAAAIPELITGDQPEFEQNLAGVLGVLEQAETLIPSVHDQVENQIAVPGVLWRFWKAYGGADRFGLPLATATMKDGVTRQIFERAILELHPERANSAELVQVAPLGRAAALGQQFASVDGAEDGRFFGETGHSLHAGFLAFWDEFDGMRLLGFPLSEEVHGIAAAGRQRTMQYFERGVLSYDEQQGIRLEPLGWYQLQRQRLAQAPLAQTFR